MLWWIVLAVVVLVVVVALVLRSRRSHGTSSGVDPAKVRSGSWNNEGRGFGAAGRF